MTRYAIEAADFKLFVVLWNQQMNLRTPAIHMKMADWLEQSWKKGDLHLLLMAFRSSGKSTIAGLFAAWLLYSKPDLRILVLAADSILAGKMARNVKRILEKHPLTKRLKPDRPDQWANDRFTVKRMMELRDPSMMAKGISANITGSRADVVICDDVEVPNTCDTAEKRKELRHKLDEISYVLVPGGTQIYIGTPHTYFSIYAHEPRTEIGEDKPYLQGFKRCEVPIINAQNESAWPERYGVHKIADMKKRAGPNKFASQMMLRPVNIAEGRLDSSNIGTYADPLDYTPEIRTLFLGETKLISASAWWDPAFGSAKGDHSVLAVLFSDAKGTLFLHKVHYITLENLQDLDEATYQCREIAEIAKACYLPSITVETNGIGRFLPAVLRNELVRAKAPCAVKEFANRRPKDLRILEAFDAVLAARRLKIHADVLKTSFMTEMTEWRPGATKGHDDGLDAVAGAIAQEPIRLERLYGKGTQSWTNASGSFDADTNFKV